jgi:hypothetical protein
MKAKSSQLSPACRIFVRGGNWQLAGRGGFTKGGHEPLTVLDAIRGTVAKSLGRHDDFLGQLESYINPSRICSEFWTCAWAC